MGGDEGMKSDDRAFRYVGPVRLPLDWSGVAAKQCTLGYYRFSEETLLVAHVGDLAAVKTPPLVRIQSACALGDLFDSKWCDCAWQFAEAKRRIFAEGSGLLIHAFDQHGKGVGLENHFRVYAEGQKRSLELLTDAFDFLGLRYENRDYQPVAAVLKQLGIESFRLLTNDPVRLDFFNSEGFHVEREPLEAPLDEYNSQELKIKKEAFHHFLSLGKSRRSYEG